MNEEWRDIKGYEGLYQVSNTGKVRNISYNYQLRLYCRPDGYEQVILCKNGKVKAFRVHRLVAEAFIPNINDLPEVNHKDENKLNNYYENLEWCDSLYNKNYRGSKQKMYE